MVNRDISVYIISITSFAMFISAMGLYLTNEYEFSCTKYENKSCVDKRYKISKWISIIFGTIAVLGFIAFVSIGFNRVFFENKA